MDEQGAIGAYRNRDLSWLDFNGRILEEASNPKVPTLEKLKFLAIYSSNLDEFFRVRMPVMAAIKRLQKKQNLQLSELKAGAVKNAKQLIGLQQSHYGKILTHHVIPELKQRNIFLTYNEPIPEIIKLQTVQYFYTHLSAFLEISFEHEVEFFPENNQLYFLVDFDDDDRICFVNIPSGQLSRFFCVEGEEGKYIVFIDDILRQNIHVLFPNRKIKGLYSFKITRDADIDLANEYEGDLARKIEQQIKKRDLGLATRLLVQPDISDNRLVHLLKLFQLRKSRGMRGGHYHNLSDFFGFPANDPKLKYPPQPALSIPQSYSHFLFGDIRKADLLVSTPYHSYDTVLRFFNEAAIDQEVDEVHCTMYRVARDSQILHALMSAAKNGKKVTVFVELKARFDEENNIHWARMLRKAGVRVLYSIPNLKVHAKVALIRRSSEYFGLFSTGNLNESTSDTYADHILLTAHPGMVDDLKQLFKFLARARGVPQEYNIHFDHLLVAQFNLADRFVALIDNEIEDARKGLPATITIKINNLEERGMISKLYEAAESGVQVNLIVRSVCCLIPEGKSNIRITRIVDRYLEHSRVFIFHNSGEEKIYMGSADWMTRNIYHRIEVCFPVYDPKLREEVTDIIRIQLKEDTSTGQRAQQEIYYYLKQKQQKPTHDND